MFLDFNTMDVTVIPGMKGGEGEVQARLHSDANGKIMLAHIPQGASIGMHTHDTSSETIYVLSGQGKTICDGVEQALLPGQCSYCGKGSAHTLINTGVEDLVFFAVIPEL